MNKKLNAKAISKLAMMAAISLGLLLLVRIPFPPAPFLVYDPADMPIYITAFAYGPWAGLVVTVIVSLIQAFMLGGDGLYGFLMHVVATGIVAVVIGSSNLTTEPCVKAEEIFTLPFNCAIFV